MSRHPLTSRTKRLLGRVAIPGVLVVALMVAVASYAFFTSTGAGTGTAGTLTSLSAPLVSPTGAPSFNLANMAPGDSETESVTVTALGGAGSQITLYEQNPTGTLLSELKLEIVEDGSTVVYNGPLASGWTAAAPLTLPGAAGGDTWASDQKHSFLFTVTFPLSGDNSFQQTSASVSFVWQRELG